MFREEASESLRQIIFGSTIAFLILAGFVIFFLVMYLRRKNKNIFEKQQLQSQFEKSLLQTQLEIQEQTLKTISEEIHDNVGQVLSLAKLNLGTFEETENKYNQELIDNTRQLVGKAINDLRELSRSLYGDKIAELGLHESIANELKILQNTGQYKTQLKVSGDSFKLAAQKEMVLFRIVQQAMNNAIKHAKAKKIEVHTVYSPGLFKMIITDDGIGFDMDALQAAKTGIGLKSMQSRAALIGGILSLDSKPGNGTTISIELSTSNNITE